MGKPSPNVHIRYPTPYILANMVVKYQKVRIHISEYENLGNPIFDYGEFGNGIFDYGESGNGTVHTSCLYDPSPSRRFFWPKYLFTVDESRRVFVPKYIFIFLADSR